MKLYLDTSALAKLYYPEPESAAVERWVGEREGPMLFTPLHELELTNACALKLFRNEITQDQFESVLDAFLTNDARQLQLATTAGVEAFAVER